MTPPKKGGKIGKIRVFPRGQKRPFFGVFWGLFYPQKPSYWFSKMAQNQLWKVKKTLKKGSFYHTQHKFLPIKYMPKSGCWEAKIIKKTRFFEKKSGENQNRKKRGEEIPGKFPENPRKFGRLTHFVKKCPILIDFGSIFNDFFV